MKSAFKNYETSPWQEENFLDKDLFGIQRKRECFHPGIAYPLINSRVRKVMVLQLEVLTLNLKKTQTKSVLCVVLTRC